MSAPIGVYDSGFGGLSVLRHIRRVLPDHDVVYFGDSGRGPYGGRDHHTLLDFGEQSIELLFAEGCRLVVVACHTMSCVGLRHLQQRYAGPDRRILGVTIPAAELAVQHSQGVIGVLATERTVQSGTWATEVHKLAPDHVVKQQAARLLAPLVEEGWEATELAHGAVQRYLDALGPVDTLLLGCTHYPFLVDVIAQHTDATVLDPAGYVAGRLRDWLDRHPAFDEPGTGALRVLCSGDPARFEDAGQRFLGEPFTAEHVAVRDGRLIRSDPAQAPRGQVVR